MENSADWIVLVDEAHRTQEKDLGAFLRATFPEARLFGFTGTPVKKGDLDTFHNFSPPGEGYLDRYSIDDAVADGATVPIRYTSRKAEWHVDPEKLDILFDHWFADEPEERLEAIKKRGVTMAELAKHPRRVELIAFDIWTHFKGHAYPDGYKAQIVAIDRRGDHPLQAGARPGDRRGSRDGRAVSPARRGRGRRRCRCRSSRRPRRTPSRARTRGWTGSAPTCAATPWTRRAEKRAIAAFQKHGEPPFFLIVCNKLLTGFDAPAESVMYLDSPLTDHNLLQAIARTNRVAGPKKRFGLIVDYIGVTRKLDEALAAYREEDVENAMQDLEVERDALRKAHREVFRDGAGADRRHERRLRRPGGGPRDGGRLVHLPSQGGRVHPGLREPEPRPGDPGVPGRSEVDRRLHPVRDADHREGSAAGPERRERQDPPAPGGASGRDRASARW